jgi:hypothetical protein
VDESRTPGLVLGILVVAGAFFLIFGAWAFLSPRGFYDSVVTWPPYNKHLLHDIGAFQMGLGASLIAAVKWKDGVLVALAGAAVGSVLHEVAHIIDRSHGGSSSDPYTLGLFAAAVVAGFLARLRSV